MTPSPRLAPPPAHPPSGSWELVEETGVSSSSHTGHLVAAHAPHLCLAHSSSSRPDPNIPIPFSACSSTDLSNLVNSSFFLSSPLKGPSEMRQGSCFVHCSPVSTSVCPQQVLSKYWLNEQVSLEKCASWSALPGQACAWSTSWSHVAAAGTMPASHSAPHTDVIGEHFRGRMPVCL